MLGISRFLLGLLREAPDAVGAQIDLWDRSNVFQASWDQAKSRSQLARNAETAINERVVKPLGQALRNGLATSQSGSTEKFESERPHPLDRHVMKFARLADHAKLKLEHPVDEPQLQQLGLEIERDAVRTLREVDSRGLVARLRGLPRTGFEGTSLDDLVRYVIQQTFHNIDAEFRKKPPAEQEKIAELVSSRLRDLPPEEQERIRESAGLPDLTAETLKQAGALASIGLGFSSLVGLAGFSAYTTLTSIVAGITGLIGFHLSFSTYMALTSLMAGLANPLVFVPAIAGGGAWMASKANRSIRSMLYPTLVATSVLADAAAAERKRDVAAFRDRLSVLILDINSATGPRQISLVRQFPGLGKPSLTSRIASHVPA